MTSQFFYKIFIIIKLVSKPIFIVAYHLLIVNIYFISGQEKRICYFNIFLKHLLQCTFVFYLQIILKKIKKLL